MQNELNNPQKNPQNELIDRAPRKATIHDFKTNISRYLAELRGGYTGGIILCRYKRPVAVILRPKTKAEEAREEAELAALIHARALKRFAAQRRVHRARMLSWRAPNA